MGCVNSRTDINDLHPNVFQVMNVDDLGNLLTPGSLEITESDIALYQRGKQPVKWPLRCLRRYGYDSEIFSFESGRRCSTGPGIYAFKCRRADRLFNLVQTNIQVCNSGVDDAVSRDLSVMGHAAAPPTIARGSAAPIETNYLDPTPIRSGGRATSRFSHVQQNGIGRLGSVGSSSGGPVSPQGTVGSPSPPPVSCTGTAPLCLPPPPPLTAHHHHRRAAPSAVYVNEQVLSAIAMEMELDNNNKTLRRTMQRSHTMCSSTSSSGLLSDHQSGMTLLSHQETNKGKSPPLISATYMNVDINVDPLSPVSPAHTTCPTLMDRIKDGHADRACRHAYMNTSPCQETTPTTSSESSTCTLVRPSALTLPPAQQQQVGEWEDAHCYANLETAEIQGLKNLRYSGTAATPGSEKSPVQLPLPAPQPLPAPPPPPPPQTCTPPPPSEPIREVNYAVLDLDKKNMTAEAAAANPPETAPSPPDSPNKPQKGYATIDFNKTAALSHSVNPNAVNDNEGSRKTRHNSTINDLTAPASRHSSSISE